RKLLVSSSWRRRLAQIHDIDTAHLINGKTSRARSGVSAGRCNIDDLGFAGIEPVGLIEVDEGIRRPNVDVRSCSKLTIGSGFSKRSSSTFVAILAARCWCPAYFIELSSFSGWERVHRSERYRHRHRRLQRINHCRLTTKPLGVR